MKIRQGKKTGYAPPAQVFLSYLAKTCCTGRVESAFAVFVMYLEKKQMIKLIQVLPLKINSQLPILNPQFSIRYFWDFLAHFLTSNSRHGTHSPFVYALADKVVYRRSRVGSSKKTVVPEGFAPRHLSLLRDVMAYLSVNKPADFQLDAEAPALLADLNTVSVEVIGEAVYGGKIVIVHEPFKTRSSKRLWQKLIREETVTVSINLFHFGLLLRRDGQHKEDFKLRYPLSFFPHKWHR